MYGKKIVEKYRSRALDTLGYEFFEESNHFGAPIKPKDYRLTAELPTFWEFVQFLISLPKSEFDEHWLSPTTSCSVCLIHYDHIVHFENFPDEIRYVWKDLGITTEWDDKHEEKSNSSEITKTYFKMLSEKDIWSLYQIYRVDFDMFGYHFEFETLKSESLKK